MERNLGALTEERAALLAQSTELTQSRDQLAFQKETLEAEKQVLVSERLALLTDKEVLETQHQDLITERDLLNASLIQLETQNRNLEEGRQELILQRDSLVQSRDQIDLERQSLASEVENLSVLRRQLQTDLEALRQENRELEFQRSALSEESLRKQSTIEDLAQKERLLSNQLAEISRQLEQLTTTSTREVDTLTQRNLSLSEQLDDVNLQLAQLHLELTRHKEQEVSLLGQLAERQQEFDLLQQREQNVQQQFAVASEELGVLVRQIQERERENRALQAEADRQGSLFVSLQEEYEALDERYRSLVRAARSPAGKEVVQVYFLRGTGGYEYRLTLPGGSEPELVTRGELDRLLAALKARHGRDLYTRVIIPENSNLSHNEAWRFTQEILNRYDYYYQPAERNE